MKYIFFVLVFCSLNVALADNRSMQNTTGQMISQDIAEIPSGCQDNNHDGKCDTTGRDMPRKDSGDRKPNNKGARGSQAVRN